MKYSLVISIVSHGQMQMVNTLLKDLEKFNLDSTIIIVRSNIREDFSLVTRGLNIEHLKNLTIKGFAENHNENYHIHECDYFAVINPDLRVSDLDTFNKLMAYSKHKKDQYILSPSVKAPNGDVEDAARYFPTVPRILKKILFGAKGTYPISPMSGPTFVDWVGGMFHFFPAEIFMKLGGYDEKYFLYYEDVDICYRAGRNSINTCIFPNIWVTHNAQRDSHRNFKYLIIHVKSLVRFWTKFYLNKP